MTGIVKEFRDHNKNIASLDGAISTMSSNCTKLANQITTQIANNVEANAHDSSFVEEPVWR